MINCKTISSVDKGRCTGCGACYNKCPVGAIEMKYDVEGFLFPDINHEKCIQCGLCARVCPELDSKVIKQDFHAEGVCYAAMAEDEIRMTSSSGGMFTLLAENIYKKEGIVCGAVYSDDYSKVYHIVSEKVEDLQWLRGSKYVQSDIGKTYFYVKEALDKKRYVLFVGCPCQVAGLYAYLDGRKYETLYTIDLVCHGANSIYAYQSYITEIANGKEIEKVNFRDKSIFGWSTPVTISFTDGSVYSAAWNENKWYDAFLGGMINRKCCSKCHYAKRERIADITLGDFWQIHKWNKDYNDWKGTSLVLLNSDKGKQIYGEIENRLKLSKVAPLDFAVQYNGQLSRPPKAAEGRKYFFNHLQKDGFHKAWWYGRRWRYDVGLVGWWFSANYGSVLTYYALGKILEDMDLLPILVRIPKKDNKGWETITEKNIEFMQKYFFVTKPRKFEEMHKCNQFCDMFLLGSDQLWVHTYNRLLGYTFYLDFAEANKKKIAYATSLGYSEYKGDPEDKKIVKTLLKRFDAISVRESSGVELCKNEFDIDVKRELDPVFLCNVAHYDILAEQAKIKENEKYILCYILDPTEEKRNAIRKLEQKYQAESRIVLDMRNFDQSVIAWQDEKILMDVGIEDFVYLIKNCSFLFTDSHHGVCFGLIYHKNIATVANARRGRTRFDSLFKLLEMEEALLEEDTLCDKIEQIVEIDYKKVDSILKREKEEALKWLREALFLQKKNEESSEDLFAKYFNMLQRERIVRES